MNLEEPFLTDPKQIKAWLASMGVKRWMGVNWEINEAGLVDVAGNVNVAGKLGSLAKLPVRFGKVGGNFFCHNNQLVSLEGAPKEVSGNFWCDNNLLVSLEGAPEKVGAGFFCYNNRLKSLEGAPEEVGGVFYCFRNRLASLEGAPKKVGGHFRCNHNLLVAFKGLDGVSIAGDLVVADPDEAGQDNIFVSLDGLPKELYGKVVGLDMQVLLELDKKRASGLLGNEEREELSSEVELG